eukprot:g24101.t1
MSTEAKTAEEEFGVMSCLKFVKVGMERDKAEAFADYGAFGIGERKVRRDGEYPIGGREFGEGERVRGKSTMHDNGKQLFLSTGNVHVLGLENYFY